MSGKRLRSELWRVGLALSMIANAALLVILLGRGDPSETPETSEHTSIKRRIEHAKAGRLPKELMPFQGDAHHGNEVGATAQEARL